MTCSSGEKRCCPSSSSSVSPGLAGAVWCSWGDRSPQTPISAHILGRLISQVGPPTGPLPSCLSFPALAEEGEDGGSYHSDSNAGGKSRGFLLPAVIILSDCSTRGAGSLALQTGGSHPAEPGAMGLPAEPRPHTAPRYLPAESPSASHGCLGAAFLPLTIFFYAMTFFISFPPVPCDLMQN